MTLLASRRDLIRTAAVGGSALLLPGCVTAPAARLRPTGCLPPVNVSADRVIRTAAGLRPYRASGFVVRAEALGDKKLVHNYGHGGAGITLSWGTSKLAAELGLPGHSGPVAVIGAGVMGLSTARLVQEAGFPVTVYAAALPPETTSNIAGGQWHPYGHFEREKVTPQWLEQFRRARALFGDDELRPARGQLAILLPQPEVRYAFTGEAGYMFPRPDGIVLGGTFELDQWTAEPEPATIARILASHKALFDGFRCASAG